MKPIRVLIVEDSAVIREFLQHIIARDCRLVVVAAVPTAEEALRILGVVKPDVISLDIWLPGMDGFAATRAIMAERPTPIVVLSAGSAEKDLDLTMKALEAGALTVLNKPASGSQNDYEIMAERLCTQLAIMSQVKVVRQRIQRVLEPARPIRPATNGARSSLTAQPTMLGIACSTGGPAALSHLLTALGSDFPLPILLVQHMTASFIEGFASWLESVSPFSVVLLDVPEVPARGKIYMARADRHLSMDGMQVSIASGDPVCAERPSATVLFDSMAKVAGPHAIAALLTGMGEDGAKGLLGLRNAGGYTIAEDRTTATVYGMPGAAVRIGAACESLPLPKIAPRIHELVSGWEAA